jgi:hypothetical protein
MVIAVLSTPLASIVQSLAKNPSQIHPIHARRSIPENAPAAHTKSKKMDFHGFLTLF